MQKFLRTLMLAALLLPFASQAQETVTIGEGTSTTYVTPFNSLWGYSFVEQIYLASEIGTDGNITAVRFYLSSGTQTNNITLYMKNVTRSTFSSTSDYESVSASDIVYTGSVTFASGWVEILLDQPFEYDGSSNLLVAMHEYTSGYSTLYFNYTEATDRVITFHSDSADPDPYNLGSYSGNKYTSANRANIQLDIEPAGEVSCYAVKGLNVSDVSGHTVTLSWSDTSNSGATYDIYQIAPSADNDSIIDTNLLDNTSEYSYTISGLAPETSFRFGVAANCGADGPSNTRFVDATTTVACPVPTNVTYTLTSVYSTVDVAWVDHNASAWELRYWTGTDTSEIIQLDDTVYSIENLLSNTNYRFQVRAVCGDEDGSSQWTPASGRSFTTPLACRVPIQLTAILDPAEPTTATITWVDTIANAWQVALNGDTNDLIDVTETSISFDTLTPETIYTIMVRANCGDFVSPWTNVLSFEPTTKTVIGTPASTNNYMPTNSNYNYSLTQQIYTAAELGNTPGAIMSVDFMNDGTAQTRTIDVYMVSTTDSTISTFIPVTASDLVFSGTVTFTPNVWTSLVFDSPFMFDGSSNVLLVVDDNNGSYSYGLSCKTFNAPSQAIYVYSDGTNYNPFAPSGYSGTVLNMKNHVRFLIGEPPTCIPVGDLTIDETATTANSITLTWSDTNAVNNYNIYIINGDNDSLIDNTTEMTYTITDLEAHTAYTFGVTANCGDEETPMRTVSGRTDCEGGSCNIQLVLHDSYGDGWNGNAISVSQAGESLGSYTISDGDSATYNVSVCSGAPVSFSWTEGSYAYETSFEILDGGGLTAYSCTDGSNISGTFTTLNDACPSCLPVMDMTVDTISTESVTISWTSEAENFLFLLDGEEYEGSADGNTITIDELEPSTTYTFGVIVVCDADDSSSMATITFSTPCVAVTVDAETPFFEGFEGTDFAPNCWTNEHISGPGSYLWQRNTSSSYVHEGSASAKLPDMNATTYTNLVTPNITINSQDESYRVSFWMYRVSSTKPNEGVRVWANTLPTTAGGVELMHIRRGYGMGTITETAEGWYKYTAIIPDSLLESFYIVFEGISEYGNASYIDDITIDRAPNCVAVTDFSIDDSSITAHAATFEWESEGTNFQFEYKTHNDTIWTVVEISDNPYELTGLEANTHYDARVKVLCENDASDYSSVRDFWTLISCPAPTNLRAVLTPGDGTVATVVWTDTVGTAWQVCIPGEEDSTFIAVTDTTAYSFTDLTPETNYTVLVRRNCEDEEEGFSTWTSVTFQPTLKIVVGTPASTSSYLPTYSTYNYELTQQIYTAAELGNTPGAIMSVDFMNGGTEKTRNIDVYMVSTTDSTISTFIPVTASDLVFSGSVTFTPNVWTSLVFDNPFMFDGSSNVLLVVDDNTGSWSGGLSCYTFNAPSQAIYVYSDGTNYNPFAPSSYSGTVLSVKNHVRFLIGEPPTCMPVGDLTIDETATTANSITLTWSDTNAVNNYNIYIINGDNDSLIGTTTEMTYTITDLEATTAYTFGVAVNCGDEVSTMRTVSGRTDCEGGSCNIELVLHDSYGDGWNGNAIDVIQSGESLGSYTIASGSSATYTVSVCSGAPVSFSWTAGSYPSETSFEIKDGAGLTVYTCTDGSSLSGTFTTIADPCPSCLPVADFEVSEIGNHSAMLSWTEQGEATSWQVMIDGDTTNAITVNDTEYELTGLSSDSSYTVTVRAICDDEDMSAWATGITFNTLVACPTPTALMADVLPTSAELTWNGFADAYQLEYALIPENTDTNASNEGIWLQYDNGNNSNNIGNANGGTFTWGTMYPAAMLAGNSNLTKVAVYENSSYLTSPYTVNVYTGGTTAPGTLVATETVTPMGTNGIHEVNLSTIANINPSDNLWVTVTATGTYIIAACTVTPVDPNNQWIEDGGTWANIGDLASTLANYSWMIRAYVEPGFDEDQMTWTVVNNVTSPYTLNNLTPESHYAVRVKAVCGTDGESDYAYTTFFTPSACADVENITVSDITSVSANLSWHGYQNSYDVRYRVPAHLTPIMVEGFESGIPATWTTIDGDNDSNNWFALSDLATIYPYYADEDESSHAWQHSGENAACSPSYANGEGAFNSSHWLITPQLNLQGVMKCYVGSVLSSYLDSYEVLLSTTGIDTSNFTITLKPMATAAAINNGWDEVSIDLSAYEGQQGYIAIHHVSSDMYFLVVDDFGIYGDTIDAGPWTEMTVNTASTALAGLNPETTYEYQVRGICGAGQYTDWSEAATFTTEAASCIVYGDTTTATACDSYTWNGQVYTQSGTYTQTLTTAANCDSILTLILTINNSVAVTVTESAETSYTWNGQTYTESGVYTWTGTTVAGCDSTVTLVLTIGGTQPTTYTVTVHYDATMGNVTGIPTGPVAAGTQVTLTANPLTGYHFMNWSTGDTTRTITLTVNSDIDITANFEANQIEDTYTVTVNYDATMGTVTGIPMAPVTAGTEVTLTATALPGFAFVNWSTGDTTATITITVTANIEITANFRSTIGIEDADMNSVSIFSANSTIYVKGAEGQNIYVYDLNGRTIATKLNATETMEIPMEQTGVYLVRVGNASAKRVIVMR